MRFSFLHSKDDDDDSKVSESVCCHRECVDVSYVVGAPLLSTVMVLLWYGLQPHQ